MDYLIDVPGTLDAALEVLTVNGSVEPDPAGWSQAEKDRLISKYIAARATAEMTDPVDRAARLTQIVRSGKLSARRNSFA